MAVGVDWWLMIITGLAGLAGLVVGIAGIIQARRANRVAEHSNELAEAANRVAGDAVRKAAEANQIAEHANTLSEEANTLARRGVTQQEEDCFVDWAAKWKGKAGELRLENVGRDLASRVSVVVNGENLHQVWDGGEPDVPAGECILVPLPQVVEHRDAHQARELRAAQGFGRGYMMARFRATLAVTVRWRTGAGFPASKQIEVKVG